MKVLALEKRRIENDIEKLAVEKHRTKYFQGNASQRPVFSFNILYETLASLHRPPVQSGAPLTPFYPVQERLL